MREGSLIQTVLQTVPLRVWQADCSGFRSSVGNAATRCFISDMWPPAVARWHCVRAAAAEACSSRQCSSSGRRAAALECSDNAASPA